MSENHYKNYAPFVDYIPAKLHEGKNWYISFYIKHPADNKLVRKRIKVNRIKSIIERRKFALKLVHRINIKLAEGWNPYYEEEPRNALFKLSDALGAFTRDKRGLRHDSTRSYNSYIKIFSQFILEDFESNITVISFRKNHALQFMDYVYNKRNVSSNTYNNYLRFMKTLFNWFIDHNYCKESPFKDIKRKTRTEKQRIMDIDNYTRDKIRKYLIDRHYEFYVMVLVAFHCLLRPREITFMKVKDVNLEAQAIFIDGRNAKNHNDRISTIPDTMAPYLEKLNLSEHNKEHYVFSDKFKVGSKRIDPRLISKRWSKLREEIGLPMEIQFYSLRDSGIIQLLKDGISPKEVMELADHSSLEITNKYVKKARVEASEVIKKKSSGF